jgi:ATP-dependent Clp protease ATP-binding subunit ClpC
MSPDPQEQPSANVSSKIDQAVSGLIQLARRESARLSHEYVGTEHLLIAMLRSPDRVLADVLAILGVEPNATIARTLEQMKKATPKAVYPDSIPFTSRAKRVMELSFSASRLFQREMVQPEHLLLGLIAEGEGIAARILLAAGATTATAVSAVAAVMGIPLPTGDLSTSPAEVPPPNAAYVESTRFDSLREALGADAQQLTELVVLADIDRVDANCLVEILASLDMLHRAWGGRGLVLGAQHVGVARGTEVLA